MEIDNRDKEEFFKEARTDIRGPLEGIRVLEVRPPLPDPAVAPFSRATGRT